MRRTLALVFSAVAVAACEPDVMKEIDRKVAERAKKAEASAAENRAWLEKNAAKPGVKTTQSGLQYEVVRALDADLARPTAADRVRVHYEGKLIDGTVFDSSYARNEPAEFVLGEVIPGWTEALQLMKPGEEFTLYLPPEIGYGARGAPPDIPPNSALIFRVELLGFERPDGSTVAR